MESGDKSKSRSQSVGSQKTLEASTGDKAAKNIQASSGDEGARGSNVSPDSSEAGTLKKPRKFKPGKFIAKKLKIKKSDKNQEQDPDLSATGESEQESEKKPGKFSSPKLQRFNFVKRFSGKRSYKVTPISDVSGEEEKSNLKHLDDSSTSEISNRAQSTGVESVSTEFLSVEENDVDEVFESPRESVTLESKKVELKITISGKLSSSPNASERAVLDKASLPLNEPSQLSRTDIILPSSSTQVQETDERDRFFDVRVPENKEKPINEAEQTFSAVVKEGLSVQSKPSESSSEVEKYLILTSSLNTILGAAKDLDDLGSGKDLKFPQYPELKIREGNSESEEQPPSTKSPPIPSERVNKFTTSTPIATGSEEMKKQGRKLKNKDSNEATTTVHTQEASKPYHLNLTAPTSDNAKGSSAITPQSEEIKFEVGTPVRPQRTSPAVSTQQLAPLEMAPLTSDSIDDSFHSPNSEKSLPTESSRRRIAYVPQLTIYTPEEQELLKSNILANADSFDVNSMPPDSSMFPVFDDSGENMTGTSSPDKREHLYKILVIGELGTGKTSFIKRYVHQFFSQNYRATIGVDFALKVLNWDQSTIIRLQLWDIAGQERFGNMTRVYYKEAVGAFIVFDVTRSATFDAVIKWKADLDAKVQLPDGQPIPCVLLANKCDSTKQGLVTMPAKMDEYCKQNGFAGWFETSAKDNVNIEESAKSLVSKILLNDKLIHSENEGDGFVLDPEDSDQKKKFCSC